MIATASIFLLLSLALAVAAAVRHSAAGSRTRRARFAAAIDLADVDRTNDKLVEVDADARIYFLDVYRAARASAHADSVSGSQRSAPALRSVSFGAGPSVGATPARGPRVSGRPRPA